MPDKVNPALKIVLDKERHLLLDLNAMVAFQEETGKNLFKKEVAESLSKDMTPKDLRAMLWACLLHEEKTLKIEQVGSWIHQGNMEEIGRKLNEAWEVATPEAEEGEEEAPLAESPPTG